MKALIIGYQGQDGQYLIRLLNRLGVEWKGLGRNDNCDLNDFCEVENFINNYKPDYIFHLAAISSTAHSYLFENHKIIVNASLNICEAVYSLGLDCKIFLAGSGLQFNNIGIAIQESDPFDPKDAYSMSRIHSVFVARYYRNLGLRVYVGYLYNHDSPLRGLDHLNMKILKFAQNIGNGKFSNKLKIGNVEAKKEFGFSGDIVKGIWTLVNQEQIFEANIGTGNAHSIAEWLKLCFMHYGHDWNDFVEIDNSYISPYKILVSDPKKINSLGWKHETSIKELFNLMIKGDGQ